MKEGYNSVQDLLQSVTAMSKLSSDLKKTKVTCQICGAKLPISIFYKKVYSKSFHKCAYSLVYNKLDEISNALFSHNLQYFIDKCKELDKVVGHYIVHSIVKSNQWENINHKITRHLNPITQWNIAGYNSFVPSYEDGMHDIIKFKGRAPTCHYIASLACFLKEEPRNNLINSLFKEGGKIYSYFETLLNRRKKYLVDAEEQSKEDLKEVELYHNQIVNSVEHGHGGTAYDIRNFVLKLKEYMRSEFLMKLPADIFGIKDEYFSNFNRSVFFSCVYAQRIHDVLYIMCERYENMPKGTVYIIFRIPTDIYSPIGIVEEGIGEDSILSLEKSMREQSFLQLLQRNNIAI